jgi:hypothetical protein
VLGQFASNAWAEIIGKAAVSPLGIFALMILVIGFVILALVRSKDKVSTRLTVIALLLLFCAALSLAALYSVEPTTATPPPVVQAPAQTSPSLPQAQGAPAETRPSRQDCGTAWSDWIEVGGAVGNPCPAGCARGDELGQSYRAVGFPPRPQTKHKFQCWRG